MPDKSDLIELGKSWLEHAPKSASPGPADLVGFTDPLDFVCSKCFGRLLARGTWTQRLAKDPIWVDKYNGQACDLCGAILGKALEIRAEKIIRKRD